MAGKFENNYGVIMWIILALIPLGVIVTIAGTMNSMQTIGTRDSSAITTIYSGYIISGIGLFGTLIMLVSGVVKGKNEFKGTGIVRRVPGVKVISRYVYNKQGEMVFDEYLYDDESQHKFYIKLLMPDGSNLEVQGPRQVWDYCGEGLKGEAHLDGKWLGKFEPWVGRPDAQ